MPLNIYTVSPLYTDNVPLTKLPSPPHLISNN